MIDMNEFLKIGKWVFKCVVEEDDVIDVSIRMGFFLRFLVVG